jgi:flagellar hook-length control protein FliK
MTEFAGILAKLGFSGEEIEALVSDYNSRALGNDMTLADLFNAASQLSEPEAETDVAAMLDESAMPDLEDILIQLGLDVTTSQGILSDALVEGHGIDPGILAAGIRRAVAGRGTETAIGSPAGVLERMQRIGLQPDEGASAGKETGGLDGRALVSNLAQMKQAAASPGDRGDAFQQSVASVGKETGGLDDRALVTRLAQLKQAPASTVSDAGVAGKPVGDISLDRFAAILERRAAETGGLNGTSKGGAAGRSLSEMVSGFMEKTAASAEGSPERVAMPMSLEGKKPFQTSWQPGGKRFSNTEGRQHGVTSASETAGKETAGQNTPRASGQAGTAAEVQRQTGGNASGTNATSTFTDALNAAGKDKTRNTTEDPRLGMENLVREMKAGTETVSTGKAAAGRNLPGYLLDQVSRQIVRLRNAGENEISLQLKPSHLGRMSLNIEQTAAGIKVGIVVESAAARDMLLANSPDLKTALADQGLRLDRIDVETQADFGQSMAQAGRGFGQSGGRKGRWAESRRPDAGESPGEPTDTEAGTGGGAPGRLDLVA